MSSHIRHCDTSNSLQYYDEVLHLITVCYEPTLKFHSAYVITINNFIPKCHRVTKKRSLILKLGSVTPGLKDTVFDRTSGY